MTREMEFPRSAVPLSAAEFSASDQPRRLHLGCGGR
jgi:hypothetical protein